jgi:hypothetical protein
MSHIGYFGETDRRIRTNPITDSGTFRSPKGRLSGAVLFFFTYFSKSSLVGLKSKIVIHEKGHFRILIYHICYGADFSSIDIAYY